MSSYSLGLRAAIQLDNHLGNRTAGCCYTGCGHTCSHLRTSHDCSQRTRAGAPQSTETTLLHVMNTVYKRQDHRTRWPRRLGGFRHHRPRCACQPSLAIVRCCPRPSALTQQFVRLRRHSSPMTQCDYGVPQGSVFGLNCSQFTGALSLVFKAANFIQ